MRFRFIEAEKAHYEIQMMCRVLKVSRSGYYAWRKRGASDREAEEQRIVKRIRQLQGTRKSSYGSPRITEELRHEGYRVGENRIARIMRDHGIVAQMPRAFRVTIQAGQKPPSQCLLKQDFQAEQGNRKWVTDITYIRTRKGWLYLAVILDLWSRAVVGWSMSERINRQLVIEALKMAQGRRRVEAGLLLHSDRGSQYTSDDFQRELARLGIVSSMSRKGNCWDNAVAESFFATLKRELEGCESGFESRLHARHELFEYIEIFYNRERRHSTLGYLSPAEFERAALQRAA